MVGSERLRVGIIGAGNIATPYGRELIAEPAIEVRGVADVVPERAQELALTLTTEGEGYPTESEGYTVRAYPSVDELLADASVDAVINLTIQRSHATVTRQALEAGKHAYSEKPLAMAYTDARSLVALARERGLRLSCAPSTFMGEAQQTAWKWIREGRLGTVRVIYAEVNWGRIERWHPRPQPFYDVGVMIDVGIYPLSVLTAIFGPARRVEAYGRVVYPDRVTKEGEPFTISTPEFVVAIVELAAGPIVRLTGSWYVMQTSKQEGIEFHGDDGSLYLASWLKGDGGVEFAPLGEPYRPVSLVRPAEKSVVWSRAVADLARAIAAGRPHRADGEQAAHLVEIMDAVNESMQTGRPVEVRSDFTPPAPMDWAG